MFTPPLLRINTRPSISITGFDAIKQGRVTGRGAGGGYTTGAVANILLG